MIRQMTPRATQRPVLSFSVAQAASLWRPRIRFPTPFPLLLVGTLLFIALTASGCRPAATKSGGDRMEPASSQDHEPSFDEQIRGVREGRLDVIAVENQTIRDQDLASLSDLKDLLVLTLDDTQITDAGLKHLRGLENLEHLRLRGAAITDTGLEHLLTLENLTILNLPQARFTDEGLARLKTLPNLEQLRFSSPHVTDAGMAELADFPALWHLHLIQVPITDRGLLPFERSTQLFSLYLDGIQVSDDGLRRLIAQRQHLSLEPLHLHIDQQHSDFDPLKGTHEH
jgi:hypothetical protein